MPLYSQCFICRQWSYLVCKSGSMHPRSNLCLPCYVDVLEVRQNRGGMSVPGELPANDVRQGGTSSDGKAPGAGDQLTMFDE